MYFEIPYEIEEFLCLSDLGKLRRLAEKALDQEQEVTLHAETALKLINQLARAQALMRHMNVFLNQFNYMFDDAWEYTLEQMNTPGYIEGTFINHGQEDPSNNWANRGFLLSVLEVLENCLRRNMPPKNRRDEDDDDRFPTK